MDNNDIVTMEVNFCFKARRDEGASRNDMTESQQRIQANANFPERCWDCWPATASLVTFITPSRRDHRSLTLRNITPSQVKRSQLRIP